jgi:SAM-dependent methyltransferase
LEPGEIRKRTVRTFDGAAPDFNASRWRPWPSIGGIGDLSGKRVLDLGAGTGRNSRHFLEGGAESVVAADLSTGMLRVLAGKKGKGAICCVRCDAIFLPFRDSAFDAVAFIATLHHLPGVAGRISAVKEVARVVSDGGVVLITVWAPQGTPKGAKQAGGEGDILVPWAKVGERYYHIFTPGELRTLVEKAGLSVVRLYHERVSRREVGANLVVVASK